MAVYSVVAAVQSLRVKWLGTIIDCKKTALEKEAKIINVFNRPPSCPELGTGALSADDAGRAGSANNGTSARGCAEPRRAERSPQCA